jgi:hypothetical protein
LLSRTQQKVVLWCEEASRYTLSKPHDQDGAARVDPKRTEYAKTEQARQAQEAKKHDMQITTCKVGSPTFVSRRCDRLREVSHTLGRACSPKLTAANAKQEPREGIAKQQCLGEASGEWTLSQSPRNASYRGLPSGSARRRPVVRGREVSLSGPAGTEGAS